MGLTLMGVGAWWFTTWCLFFSDWDREDTARMMRVVKRVRGKV